MAGGKHPAIRLGLSIVAVLVCAPPVSVLGQAPSADLGALLKLELPLDHLDLVRSDILD